MRSLPVCFVCVSLVFHVSVLYCCVHLRKFIAHIYTHILFEILHTYPYDQLPLSPSLSCEISFHMILSLLFLLRLPEHRLFTSYIRVDLHVLEGDEEGAVSPPWSYTYPSEYVLVVAGGLFLYL